MCDQVKADRTISCVVKLRPTTIFDWIRVSDQGSHQTFVNCQVQSLPLPSVDLNSNHIKKMPFDSKNHCPHVINE